MRCHVEKADFSCEFCEKKSATRFNIETHQELLFGAGFRFDFTQNVTLDCGWSFGGNLFNNCFKDVSDNCFAAQWAVSPGGQSVWFLMILALILALLCQSFP